MATLAQIQRDFIHAFYQQQPAAFTQHLSNKPVIDANTQWQIYQGSITEGLATHLRAVYAVCETVVGEAFFTGLAYEFIKQTPCYTNDLAQYGDSFADFVSTFPPAADLPYLANVCRLCWYRHCCQQQQQYSQFDIAKFALIDDAKKDEIILLLQPTHYLLHSSYPIDKIWDLCQQSNHEYAAPIDLDSGGVNLFIFWQHDQVVCNELTDQEYTVAVELAKQQPLTTLQTNLANDQINLSILLPCFLNQGWLGGWRYSNHPV